jgi:hypothetical protein
MASMSSSSLAPFCLARPRWNASWSVLPLVVSAATVTRLRSLAVSCGRVHTWPNNTSSVKPTKAGAKSPNMRCAPEGSFSWWLSAMCVLPSVLDCQRGTARRVGATSAGTTMAST